MSDTLTRDALANVRDAAMIDVPPWLAVVSALGSVRPDSIGATLDWLVAHRADLEAAYDEARAAPLALARLDDDLARTPELAGLDRAKGDHHLRDKLLFADLVGRESFFHVMVYAITGVALSPSDAAMLDEIGVANIVADQRVWPLAVARRVAGHGGDQCAAVVAGGALMGSPIVGSTAGAGAARFLRGVERAVNEGAALGDVLDAMLERRETLIGFGRPVVGPDERVAPVRASMRRHGRDDGPQVRLLLAIEAHLRARKGLRSNVGAWIAAVMGDLGFTPDGVQGVANMYLHVCLVAQAVFGVERAR